MLMVAIATDSRTIANVRPGSSRPATQQTQLAIGASFVRLESFKKGES